MPFWFVQVRRASVGAGGPTVTDVGPEEEQPTTIRAAAAARRILRCPMAVLDAMCHWPVPAGPKWRSDDRHSLPAIGDAGLFPLPQQAEPTERFKRCTRHPTADGISDARHAVQAV